MTFNKANRILLHFYRKNKNYSLMSLVKEFLDKGRTLGGLNVASATDLHNQIFQLCF